MSRNRLVAGKLSFFPYRMGDQRYSGGKDLVKFADIFRMLQQVSTVDSAFGPIDLNVTKWVVGFLLFSCCLVRNQLVQTLHFDGWDFLYQSLEKEVFHFLSK
jgi:hypothetical protein